MYNDADFQGGLPQFHILGELQPPCPHGAYAGVLYTMVYFMHRHRNHGGQGPIGVHNAPTTAIMPHSLATAPEAPSGRSPYLL